MIKAKQKKEKLLEKKFDDISSDSYESGSGSEPASEEEEEDVQNFAFERSTRTKRKIVPPKSYEPELKVKRQKK